ECMKIAEERLEKISDGEREQWGDDWSLVQKASHAERMKWFIHRKGFWPQPLKKTKKFNNSKGAHVSKGVGVKSGDQAEKIGLDAVKLAEQIEHFEEQCELHPENQKLRDC